MSESGLLSQRTTVTALAAVATGLVGAASLAYYIRRLVLRHRYWHSAYVRVGVVERLYVYPVKSCRGISVTLLSPISTPIAYAIPPPFAGAVDGLRGAGRPSC
jgi:hypothetical protein